MEQTLTANKRTFEVKAGVFTTYISNQKNILEENISLYEIEDEDGNTRISDNCEMQELLEKQFKLDADLAYKACSPIAASYCVDLRKTEDGKLEIFTMVNKDIFTCLDQVLSCLIKINQVAEMSLELEEE